MARNNQLQLVFNPCTAIAAFPANPAYAASYHDFKGVRRTRSSRRSVYYRRLLPVSHDMRASIHEHQAKQRDHINAKLIFVYIHSKTTPPTRQTPKQWPPGRVLPKPKHSPAAGRHFLFLKRREPSCEALLKAPESHKK